MIALHLHHRWEASHGLLLSMCLTTKITGPAKPAPVHHLVGRMSVSLLHCVSFMPFDKYFSAITVSSISLKRL
jgi:hypothetical protein